MPLAALGPILIGAAGTSAAATAGAWTAIATGASIGANIYGANKQSNAARSAAQTQSDAATRSAQIQADAARETARLQTEAATKAAQLQKESSDAALGFTKQQALYGAQSAETDRSANYQQWAAKERRLGSIGEMVGLGQRDIPSYVPSPTPNFDTPTPPPGPATGSAATVAGSGNPTDPAFINAQLQSVYKGLGVQPTGPGSGPTDIAYMAGKVLETGGWTPQNASYWPDRIKQELALAKNGGAAAKTTTPYRSVGDYLISPSAPTSAAVQLAPALARPAPYRSVGSYL